MTLDDQRAAKKFICASELARVFKSMICLFLTTSFLFLNLRTNMDEGMSMLSEDGDLVEAYEKDLVSIAAEENVNDYPLYNDFVTTEKDLVEP